MYWRPWTVHGVNACVAVGVQESSFSLSEPIFGFIAGIIGIVGCAVSIVALLLALRQAKQAKAHMEATKKIASQATAHLSTTQKISKSMAKLAVIDAARSIELSRTPPNQRILKDYNKLVEECANELDEQDMMNRIVEIIKTHSHRE